MAERLNYTRYSRGQPLNIENMCELITTFNWKIVTKESPRPQTAPYYIIIIIELEELSARLYISTLSLISARWKLGMRWPKRRLWLPPGRFTLFSANQRAAPKTLPNEGAAFRRSRHRGSALQRLPPSRDKNFRHPMRSAFWPFEGGVGRAILARRRRARKRNFGPLCRLGGRRRG